MKSLSTFCLALACATALTIGACADNDAGDHDDDTTATVDTAGGMDLAPDSADGAPAVIGENTAEDTAETRAERGDMDTIGNPGDSNGVGDDK